ncbi:transcription elongation factor GreA [Bogoriella caseilytica]|uniref:Transcription elongation factor GreA n=1 Tax=Bogoriella caseilytica TaxID=56055 RepID=A0A3N2BAB3_9MICO|nr:transcription elongation factor GreA [Bogoriella caseilytica]ROR72213.1 transcription elongation factor GreA [Bogoriella caseilytica]
MSASTTWLTQEAFDRLQAELDHLTTEGRHEIAQKIEDARQEGDLKENGGYHAAREEQAKQEARIIQLTELLRDAEVGQAPKQTEVVESGTVVTATIAGRNLTFLLGSREAARDLDIDVYSESSPLGAAVLGKKAGEKSSYEAPNGSTIEVTVEKVEPFQG